MYILIEKTALFPVLLGDVTEWTNIRCNDIRWTEI